MASGGPAIAGSTAPAFSKLFSPDTIGPGSTSTLIFTIDNVANGTPATDLTFTDALPAGVVIAAPANASTTCTGGTISATAGGSTISYTNGAVGGSSSCTVTVNVTSDTPGIYSNATSNLGSSAGDGFPASDDLIVVVGRPGFSKEFSPSTVNLNGTTRLTFTIDNSANASALGTLRFSDELPFGLTVAPTPNLSTTCGPNSLGPATITATGGSTNIAFDFSGSSSSPTSATLIGGASCTVGVDIRAGSVGTFNNVSEELTSDAVSSGVATAALTVIGSSISAPSLTKSFTNDPVGPGDIATLEFTISNSNPDFSASDLNFTDDLDAMLAGAQLTGTLPTNPCGAGSELSGTSSLSLTGGALAARASCTFTVDVRVPSGASSVGTHTNTTSVINSTVNGTSVDGGSASDVLAVVEDLAPTLSKSFVDDPVVPGDTVDLEFTITNPNATQAAADIEFLDDVSALLTGITIQSLPPDGSACGIGATFSQVIIFDDPNFSFSGGELAPGASCNFTVTLSVPISAQGGTFSNTTTAISATVNGTTRIGDTASDGLEVIAPLNLALAKQFSVDDVTPGSSVDIEFTITNGGEGVDATSISFTDDLDSFFAGSVTSGALPNDPCGAGSTLTGGSAIVLTGGSVNSGASCSFSVTVVVGSGTGTNVLNTTTDLSASPNGGSVVAAPGTAASDSINITNELPMSFSKSFGSDPVIAGGVATLEFTITNPNSSLAATDIRFIDNLSDSLSGLQGVTPYPSDPCGTGSLLSGTTRIDFTGGSLAAGASCTFSISAAVPASAADGAYNNATSQITATVGAALTVGNAATGALIVQSTALEISKSFTDDPAAAGSEVNLQFSITNLSATTSVSNLSFSDDLDAMLSGAAATGLPISVCGGSLSGTSTIALTGGSLPVAGSCTFDVAVAVPAGAAAGIFDNTTSTVTAIANALAVNGAPATDQLVVEDLTAPTFTKEFLSNPASAGGTTNLRFTISNPAGGSSLPALAFTDDLGAVLPGLAATGALPSDPCGPDSALTGTSLIALGGGNLAPDSTCSFEVQIQVPGTATAGTFTSTSSVLFDGGVFVATPASDDLTIDPAPGFSKVFSPSAILQGEISTLTFTIDNSSSALSATSLAFSDAMPTEVTIASPSNAATTCSGATLTAAVGTSEITLSNGTVAGGAICTVSVDVTALTVATYVNNSGDLTSSLGNSGTAAAALVVDAQPNGSITIIQNADADGTFNFDSSRASLTFTIVTTGGTGQHGPVSTPAGSFFITQTPPAGFGTSAISCNDTDSSGNPSSGVLTVNLSAMEDLICTFTSINSRQKTIDAINRFLTKRTDFILSNQADRNRRIDRLKRGGTGSETISFSRGDLKSLAPANFRLANAGAGSYSFSSSLMQVKQTAANVALAASPKGSSIELGRSRFDTWIEGSYQRFKDSGNSSGHFAIGYLGADYLLNENVLVGALVQVDDMKDVSDKFDTKTSGTGWMVGPYVTGRLASNFFVDARAAWGKSDNKVSPFRTYTDKFKTERWLVSGGLVGDFSIKNWRFRPNAKVSYIEEDQKAYDDALDVRIPSQTVALGQLQFGPNVSTRISTKLGIVIEPYASVDGIFNFGETRGVTVTDTAKAHLDDWRGRGEVGVRITTDHGIQLSIGGNYDGLGQSDFEAYGGDLKLVVPFD